MNLFLSAKHWQLFIIFCGSAFLSDFVTTFSIFFNLLGVGVYLAWMYAISVGMQKMVPPPAKMNVTLFKVFFFIPAIYFILILIVMDYFTKSFGGPFSGRNALIIVPVHLFSMFCIFYCLYFLAKAIKTVELQRVVTFSDFFPEFLLAWFFPIGVWILQPRINKIIKQYEESRENIVME